MAKLYIKDGIVIENSRSVKKGTVYVKDGVICEIMEKMPENYDKEAQVIEAAGKIVSPGLINGHTHSYANFYKTTRDNLPLEEMMIYIMEEGACLKPEDVYYNTMLGAIEMIRDGITSCLDQLAQKDEGLEAAIKAYEDIGMRVTMAPMYTDIGYYQSIPVNQELLYPEQREQKADDADTLLEMNVRFMKKWHEKHNRLRVGFGPSGPQRSTEYFLRRNMELAVENETIMHTHALETRTQKNTANYVYGQSMIRYMQKIGCVNERLTIAHGVWVAPDDMKILADNGATVVHCPCCNLYLGSGIADINGLRDAGVNIGLGTDGPNGGCCQNMHETMKFAGMLHRATQPDGKKWPDAKEIFEYATTGNAGILGMKGELGTIEKGKRADIVIYNPLKSPALWPLDDPVMQITFGEKGQAVETVIIEGAPVLLNGEFTMINEKSLYEKIKKHSENVQERLERKRPNVEKNIERLLSVLPRDF